MFYFSDLHVQLMAKGILNPGEQLLSQTSTFYLPWWALGFINRRNLVLATDQRLIVLEHRFRFFPVGYRLELIHSMPWASVQEAKLKGIFTKKLLVNGQGDNGPVSFKHVVPNTLFGLLAPMKNNLQGARAIDAQFKNGAAAAHQLAPAGYAQPALPAFNSPGYASVPPPAPHQPGYGHGQVPISYQNPPQQ